MILVSRSSGRLGNQLFQLSNTLNLRLQKQFVVFLGFNEAHALLGRLAVRSIRIPVPNPLYHQAKRFFRWLQSVPGVSTVTRGSRNSARDEAKHFLVELLDEQDCHYPRMLVGNDVLQRCSQIVAGMADGNPREKCFVHIRLGDYSSFIVGAGPVEIPMSWYEKQMAEIRHSNPGILFQIFSDEPAKIGERISIQPDTEVIKADTHASFAGMARSMMGILSASTFSWWAAAVAHSSGARGPFIAPAGWENWRAGTLSNPEKNSPWLRYNLVRDRGD